MSRVLKAELYRLKYNPSFWILALASAIGQCVFYYYGGDDTAFNSVITSFSSLTPVVTSLIVVAIAQADTNAGTLKNIVSCGISRISIYFGKVIAAILASLFIFLLTGFATIVYAMVMQGGIDVSAGYIIQTLLLQAIIMVNYTVVFYLIGSALHSTALAVTLCFIYNFLGGMITGLVGNSLHLGDIVNYELNVVAVDVEKVTVNTVAIEHLAIITVVIAVAGLLGAFIFSKKDVK